MSSFKNFDQLPEKLVNSLEKIGFTVPTPIQEKAIPAALEGKDILGSAQTGTGKTGAFSIPLVAKLLNNQIQGALVLTPTRELAVQVVTAIQTIVGRDTKLFTACLIGGQSIHIQLRQLQRNPQIIVGTPGRINDHLERGSVSFAKTQYLVPDEMDRMLDMGFGKQIDAIMAHIPQKIQTLMFSATMPKNIVQVASKYLKNPERIEIGSSLQPIEAIVQESIRIADGEKYQQLVQELDTREGSIIVFVKTKHGAKKIADKLYKNNFKAQAIHGNLRQNKRDFVIKGFRDSRFRILVATDVAARGLDVSHVQHVINYDLPQCPEDYIHRIGRTARAGATGKALNFITGSEERLWRAIERFMKTGDQQSQPRGNFSSQHKNNAHKKQHSDWKRDKFDPRKKVFGKKHAKFKPKFDKNTKTDSDKFKRVAFDEQFPESNFEQGLKKQKYSSFEKNLTFEKSRTSDNSIKGKSLYTFGKKDYKFSKFTQE